MKFKSKIWRYYPQLASVTEEFVTKWNIFNNDENKHITNITAYFGKKKILQNSNIPSFENGVPEDFINSTTILLEKFEGVIPKQWDVELVYNLSNENVLKVRYPYTKPIISRNIKKDNIICKYTCCHGPSRTLDVNLNIETYSNHIPEEITLEYYNTVKLNMYKDYSIESSTINNLKWVYTIHKTWNGKNLKEIENNISNGVKPILNISISSNLPISLSEKQKYVVLCSLLLKVEDLLLLPIENKLSQFGNNPLPPMFQSYCTT